eukprot:1345840-Pyramimonas_sp.AAC.1
MCAALRTTTFGTTCPQSVKLLQLLKPMFAAPRRYPHFENHPPPIRETLANFGNECARRQGESHILETTRPQSVKLLQSLKANVRGAKERAT